MKINEDNRFFIKDESLRGVDNDMFNYADISNVLRCIIETNEPPYNIAIIGKWGLGKSSLINLALGKYKSSKDEYLIQEINAWKYEKESLRKVFLKQLWQGISETKLKSFQVIQKAFSDIVNSDITSTPTEANKGKAKKLICTLGLITGATVLAFIVYKLIQADIQRADIKNWTFWANVILSYCKNIAIVLLFPVLIALFKVMLDEYNLKDTKKIEISFPLETADDYELFLETKISEKLDKHPDLKFITIIDDLDRLSIEKIVEALDTLKAFVGLQRCIFIVPFDDEIIKRALEKRRIRQFDGEDDIIESELILDKLFQFKIYLPPLLKYDIKQYASDLITQEIPGFLHDYCSPETMKKLLDRIIIHSAVATPRQVKKLVNAFVSNYMVSCEREVSGKVEKGLLTSDIGKEQIAKFSVLQADFNRFYDLLFQDFNYLNQILDFHQGHTNKLEMSKELSDYFIFDDTGKNLGIAPEHEALINFLNRTKKYEVQSIAPYLYLAQDDISKKTGDEVQRRAINALESGNIESLREMLQKSPAISSAIAYHVNTANDDLETLLANTISTFANIEDEENQVTLANSIVDRTLELKDDQAKFLYELPPKSLWDISQIVPNKAFGTGFINIYFTCLLNQDWLQPQYIIDAIATILPKWSLLSDNSQELIDRIAELCVSSQNIEAEKLFPIVDYDSAVFGRLWGLPWFNKLCSYITETDDFGDTVQEHLKHTFTNLTEANSIADLVALLLPLTQYSALVKIIDTMLTAPLCKKIDAKQATQIVDNIIALDYKACNKSIYNLMSKLDYVISDKNAQAMCDFTMHYKESSKMDDVLNYCGTHGYFNLLDPTIQNVIKDVFDDGSNDELLEKIQDYFTDAQRQTLFSNLASQSSFASNKTYERQTMLFSILAKKAKNKDQLDNIVSTVLVPLLASYYNQPNYLAFVSESVGFVKKLLHTSSINAYIARIASIFNAYRMPCLEAINRLTGSMTKENFSNLFPYLTQKITTSEFEHALNIIIDNNSIRPTDDTAISLYRKFLTEHVEESTDPNRVLEALRTSFGSFPELGSLVKASLKNEKTSKKVLVAVIADCFQNYTGVDMVIKEAIPMFDDEESTKMLRLAFDNVTTYKVEDIITALSNSLTETTSQEALINVIRFSVVYGNSSAFALLLKAIELSFKHDNQPDKVADTIRLINGFERNTLLQQKNKMVEILHTGFSGTTSENIKHTILDIVSSTKLRREFRKLLDEDDLDYYKQWVK